MATESDNVNSGALGTLVAVGAIVFFGIALVVTALVRAELAEETAKKEVGADRPYRDLVAEQTSKLSAPAAYVDRARGTVALPIERAMELTVSGLAKDPNSATPVAGAGGTGGAPSDAAGAAGGGVGGAGGTGGTAAVGGAPSPEGAKPADEKKDDKKTGVKPKPASPTSPAPTAGSPAPGSVSPAPAPAP